VQHRPHRLRGDRTRQPAAVVSGARRRTGKVGASSIQLDYETVVAHSAVGTTWAMQTPYRPGHKTHRAAG
jgi:hypothetical protein